VDQPRHQFERKPIVPQKTSKESRNVSKETGEPTKGRSTMAAEEFKRTAEDMKRTGEAIADDMKRTSEQFTKAASAFDFRGMSMAWKEAYLRGLQALFQSQEQNERLVKEAVKQGITAPQQALTAYEKWLEQVQGQAGVATPFLVWSQQVVRAFHATADPLLKTAAEAADSTFNYYENAVAAPSRMYAYELNRKLMDTVLSA
jgi:hypothetical protein